MSVHTVMEPATSSYRNHSRRREPNILPILVILLLLINILLIFMIIYHNTELLKEIDGCRRDVDHVLKQQIKSPNEKIKSAFHDEEGNKGASGSNRNTAAAQEKNDASTHPKRSSQARTTSNCPFSRKKQKICSYVQNEVSKQRNIIENLQNEIKRLNKEIKSLNEASEYKSKFQEQLAFHTTNYLRLIPDSGKNAQSKLYSFGGWERWRTHCERYPEQREWFCRQFPKAPELRNSMKWRINYTVSEIEIKVLGFYWFSLQLAMENSTNSCAHLISKVSIVMATPKQKDFDYVELRSQIPTPFEYTDGNEKVKLYSVSMSAPVKLHAASKLQIAVTLKSEERIQNAEKSVRLYKIKNAAMNWFTINLIEYMENDS